MPTHERFIWAAEIMSIQPAEQILEIGCGAGLLAEQIAALLKRGKITAVDRSAAMIRMAGKRNERFINKGVASFINQNFATIDLPQKAFDKLVAFNVSSFIKDGAKELELAQSFLKPKGFLFLFFQHPYEPNREMINSCERPLLNKGFTIVDTPLKKMKPYASFCIIAQS
jgi:ubiquinone/menaquinone biosynthesis C-methylase UbiE